MNTFQRSNKLNKIWLKGLNPHFSKDRKLNPVKISKRD